MVKKFTIIISLFFVVLIIILPTPKRGWGAVTNEVDHLFYETRVVEVGDEIDLNIDQLKKYYKFNRIEFRLSNTNVARINYQEKFLALDGGQTNVYVYLYDNKDLLIIINFGRFIILKNLNECIPIHDFNEFKQFLISNPKGCYYLENDIDIINTNNEIIPYFEGILLNPKKKVISDLRIQNDFYCGLFKQLNNAIIDGLILKDVSINSQNLYFYNNSVGALAATATDSYLNNIKVNGNIQNGYYVGGIVGLANNTIIYNSSFTGTVKDGRFVGGLVGYLTTPVYDYDSKLCIEKQIKNCYVICDISGTWCGAFAGIISHSIIENTYFVGNVTSNDPSNNYILSGYDRYNDSHKFVNVYHNINSDNLLSPKCVAINVVYIENFQSGEELEGMDAFLFQEGSYPILKSQS